MLLLDLTVTSSHLPCTDTVKFCIKPVKILKRSDIFSSEQLVLSYFLGGAWLVVYRFPVLTLCPVQLVGETEILWGCGVIWGSACCPGTLQHVDRWSQHWTTNPEIIGMDGWSTLPLQAEKFSSMLFIKTETQDVQPCDLVRVLRFSISGQLLTLSSLLAAILNVTRPCLESAKNSKQGLAVSESAPSCPLQFFFIIVGFF